MCNVFMSFSYGVGMVVRSLPRSFVRSFCNLYFFFSYFAFHFLWDMRACVCLYVCVSFFIPLNSSEVTYESDTKIHRVKCAIYILPSIPGCCTRSMYNTLNICIFSVFFPASLFHLCDAVLFLSSQKQNKSKPNRMFPFELLMFVVSYVIFHTHTHAHSQHTHKRGENKKN